jgi:hypothetical protein
MKRRTEILLAAAENAGMHGLSFGACHAIRAAAHGMGLQDVRADEYVWWFNDHFAPPEGVSEIDRNQVWWLGDKVRRNLGRRMTFLAMAAAVSETEE